MAIWLFIFSMYFPYIGGGSELYDDVIPKVSQIISVESWDKSKRPFPAFWAVSSISWVADSDKRGTSFEPHSLHCTKSRSYFMYLCLFTVLYLYWFLPKLFPIQLYWYLCYIQFYWMVRLLFWKPYCLNKWNVVPLQVFPSVPILNPTLHLHSKDPCWFLHMWSQPPLRTAHSLTSENNVNGILRDILQAVPRSIQTDPNIQVFVEQLYCFVKQIYC